MIANNERNGIWFYGLAGSGKTFASKTCISVVENGFIIDGDDVRKLVSFDLGYSMSDRKIQLKRVLGFALLAQKNGVFPIVSTVAMTTDILQKCHEFEIDVVQVIRPLEQLEEIRTIYRTDQNVVGKDIYLEELNTSKLYNNGCGGFEKVVINFVK